MAARLEENNIVSRRQTFIKLRREVHNQVKIDINSSVGSSLMCKSLYYCLDDDRTSRYKHARFGACPHDESNFGFTLLLTDAEKKKLHEISPALTELQGSTKIEDDDDNFSIDEHLTNHESKTQRAGRDERWCYFTIDHNAFSKELQLGAKRIPSLQGLLLGKISQIKTLKVPHIFSEYRFPANPKREYDNAVSKVKEIFRDNLEGLGRLTFHDDVFECALIALADDILKQNVKLDLEKHNLQKKADNQESQFTQACAWQGIPNNESQIRIDFNDNPAVVSPNQLKALACFFQETFDDPTCCSYDANGQTRCLIIDTGVVVTDQFVDIMNSTIITAMPYQQFSKFQHLGDYNQGEYEQVDVYTLLHNHIQQHQQIYSSPKHQCHEVNDSLLKLIDEYQVTAKESIPSCEGHHELFGKIRDQLSLLRNRVEESVTLDRDTRRVCIEEIDTINKGLKQIRVAVKKCQLQSSHYQNKRKQILHMRLAKEGAPLNKDVLSLIEGELKQEQEKNDLNDERDMPTALPLKQSPRIIARC